MLHNEYKLCKKSKHVQQRETSNGTYAFLIRMNKLLSAFKKNIYF